MLGKLNLDEFAMGSSNETSAFGPVVSPWRRKGTAVRREDRARRFVGRLRGAVAARLCLGATATDTGGSIRQPAAFTGRSASSRPMVAARAGASSPSPPRSIRPGRSPAPCATRYHAALDGRRRSKDSTSVDLPVPDYETASALGEGTAIGIPREYRLDGLSPEIDAVWEKGVEWLKDAGAEIVEISLPHTRHALPAYYMSRRRRPPPISRATTACATACASGQGHQDMDQKTRAGLRAKCAPHHDPPMCFRPAITMPIMCGRKKSVP